jgi:hypothetical protein
VCGAIAAFDGKGHEPSWALQSQINNIFVFSPLPGDKNFAPKNGKSSAHSVNFLNFTDQTE